MNKILHVLSAVLFLTHDSLFHLKIGGTSTDFAFL